MQKKIIINSDMRAAARIQTTPTGGGGGGSVKDLI